MIKICNIKKIALIICYNSIINKKMGDMYEKFRLKQTKFSNRF